MTYTASVFEMTDHIVSVLDLHKDELGLQEVFYGDQDKVPHFPSVGVESFPKNRSLSGSGAGLHTFRIELRCGIYIYHGALQATYKTKREIDELSERVEATLHTDMTMGGRVIFGYVTRTEPGVSLKSDIMVKTTRLTWEGVSKQLF